MDRCLPAFECRLTDVSGRGWLFEEQVPVVTHDDLDANSDYPQPGFLACELIKRHCDDEGREVMTIETDKPRSVESRRGDDAL